MSSESVSNELEEESGSDQMGGRDFPDVKKIRRGCPESVISFVEEMN